LRHAKSSWDRADLADHDRPLAPRGQRATKRLAKHLRSAGISPALVLCSSAERARETLDGIAPGFGGEVPVQIDRTLYGASSDAHVPVSAGSTACSFTSVSASSASGSESPTTPAPA